MKTLWIIIFSIMSSICCYAQLITEDEFEKAEEYYLPDVKLKDRSKWLFDQGWFTQDGSPMYIIIIPVDTSLTIDQVYVSAYQTIVSSFSDANVATKYNDREAGSFIVEGMAWVWGNVGLLGEFLVDIQIRVDIKKGKVRCIAIPQYYTSRYAGFGTYGRVVVGGPMPIFDKPYTEGYKESVGKSKASAKRYLRTYIWTRILMDRLQKHVTEGASGIENSDW